ncbi:GumM protein [Cellvibrio zantedeschiae]|uniref:GumM protein n=1 Tax=Cellvibrio zantedeschiae TaxID=1237077 RepID=A0ABQ3B262_9GAMM|nr:WecB/TagA/CpsF family glycosyltransferase [Cellvibrio zantedeschiae]GGY74402.1 GumM protein [Cellvibrio zantedeschiae]
MTAYALADKEISDTLILGGFPLLRTTSSDLSKQLGQVLDTNEQHLLFFANTNFIVKCQPLQKSMSAVNTLIVNDGIGVDIGTWLIHRKKFPENLNGTDFIPQYLNSVRDKARVFLFGAKPGIAQRAAETLRKVHGVNVVGTCDGYEQAKSSNQLISDMNAANANVILVAMGNPAQEKWILEHHHQLNASVFIGVGALLDFLAGDKPRAPRIVQKLRLEWFYRLCLEPSRLMRRYTFDIAIFLALCLSTAKVRKTDSPLN